MESRDSQEYGNIKVAPEYQKAVKLAATQEGISIKEWTERAIRIELARCGIKFEGVKIEEGK